MTHIKISILASGDESHRFQFSIRLRSPQPDATRFWFEPTALTILSCETPILTDAITLLQKHHIIDMSGNWIYGDGHLVLAGNCLDGSEDSVHLLWFIYGLESKALRKGGYVHFLPAGLELQHMNDHWRHEQPGYAPPATGAVSKYAILFDGNAELYRWLQMKKLIVKLGNTVILQCGLDHHPLPPQMTGSAHPPLAGIMKKMPENIHPEEISQLHSILYVETVVLLDARAGTAILSRIEKNGPSNCRLPIVRNLGNWQARKPSPATPAPEN